MDEKELIGKKIIKAEIRKLPKDDYRDDEYDDEPILFLEMEDGTKFKIVANFGGYTGKSEDEYPRYIFVEKIKLKQK